MPDTYKIIHTVSKNESFWTISQYYNVDGSQLLEFNKDKGKTAYLSTFSTRIPQWGIQKGDEIYIPYSKEEIKKQRIHRHLKALQQKNKKNLPKQNKEKLKSNSPNIGTTAKCVKCNFYKISVKCSNKKRGYVHKVSSSAGPAQVFQVIAGGS